MSYSRLSLIEREEISRELAFGTNIRTIASKLQRSPSTVSREININAVHRRFYRAVFGQQRANSIRRIEPKSPLFF